MAIKSLPETNKPSGPKARQASEQKGPGILSDRFPAISNILSRSKNTISEKVLELTNKKTKERGYKQLQSNLSSLDKMTLLAEEQNTLLREIINALKETDRPSAPSRRGGRRPRGRVTTRTRPPGRGRYGSRAQARLNRIRQIRANRLRTEAVERRRATQRPAQAERVRQPPVLETRQRAVAPTIEAAQQRPAPTTEPRTAPADADIDNIKKQADADAERIRAQANEDADRIRQQAQADAERTRAQADQDLERIRKQAEADAEKIRGQSSEEADRIRQRAEADSDSIRRQADEDANRIRNQAEADSESIRRQAEADIERVKQQAEADARRAAAPEADRRPAATAEVRPSVTGGAGRAGVLGAGIGAVAGTATGQSPGQAAAAGAQAAATTVVLSQAAEQTIRETVKKSLGREVLKKIPFAGILAGLWFGTSRAMAGDWVGAGLELTSGAAGALGGVTFGLGTAASIAIDVGLLTRDVYEAVYGVKLEDEEDPELVKQRMSALGTAITQALNELISNAPAPTTPEINNETRDSLRQIYLAAQENEDLYNAIGADVMAGLGPLLQVNVNGNSPMQRRAKEGLQNMLSRLKPLVSATNEASSRMIELPQPEPAAEPVEQDAKDLITPSSFLQDDDSSDIEEVEYDDAERVSAEPIVRTLGEDEDVESALPYPENLIEMIGRTEFNEIEIEAEKIVFDGEIKLTDSQDVEALQTPEATKRQTVFENEAVSVNEAPPVATQASASPAMAMTAAQPSMSAEVTPMTPVASTASLATPAAMPSPAATGIPPAPQSQAAPQQPQREGSTSGGGDFMSEVNKVSSRLGINPSNLLAVMRSESSLNPQAVNRSTGASGLIQFMPRTAQSLGTTVEAIRQMNAAQQMPYVEKFFQSVRLPQGASAGRLYAYVFLPGRANREILTQSGESYYEANKGLDVNRDGKITIADLDARLARYGAVGGASEATMQASAPTAGGTLAAAGTGMAAADQAQVRSGGQVAIIQAQGQQQQRAPNIVPQQASTGEVPLNIRLQKQVA
jgi:hypothetical protein